MGENYMYAQNSVELWGFPENPGSSNFRLNSFESNSVNWNTLRSWEFSTVYGGSFNGDISTNLYLVGLAKRIDKHSIYARFTPGFEQNFIFRSGTNIIIDEEIEIEQELKTTLNYSEKFGFGYSFDFSEDLSAGFSLRYFGQEFSEEKPDLNFSDSLNFITIETLTRNNNYWRGDIGIYYRVSENLKIQLSSANLIIVNEGSADEDFEDYYMKTGKEAIIGIDYNPLHRLGLVARGETDNSFLLGFNYGFPFNGDKFSIGVSAFHDNTQTPFIAGILPSINYSTEYFSITLSAVKYFSDRGGNGLLDEFVETGIKNVLNNQYSDDRLMASLNIALSFVPEAKVKFIDVEITENIYPTLYEYYMDTPFAKGRVVNLSNETVSVKPYSKIENFNDDFVYSPPLDVRPGDTALVNFFTVIPDNLELDMSRGIYQAAFFVKTAGSDPDDELRRPLLVNDRNGWNGDVNTLRYFVKSDFQFSSGYSKNVLNSYRDQILEAEEEAQNFYRTKFLFEEFIDGMLYVSDPRASGEKVQLPEETLRLKGGDCDDLSVAFSSLLESVGIQTAFVDYRSGEVRHVNLMVNTNIPPSKAPLITSNDKKYFVRKNSNGIEEVWIPVETTSLTDFGTAWNIAAEKFYSEAVQNLGLSKQDVVIIDIY